MLRRVLWHIAGTTALMMVAESTTETLVNFNQTTRCNIPEDSHLHCHRRDNLKSQDALPDGIAGSWHHTRLVIGSQYERIGASRVGPSEAKCSLHCFNDTKLVLFYGGALVHIISKRSVRCANT
jgi:hypothetical protein